MGASWKVLKEVEATAQADGLLHALPPGTWQPCDPSSSPWAGHDPARACPRRGGAVRRPVPRHADVELEDGLGCDLLRRGGLGDQFQADSQSA